jgi:hypothetical protein
MEIRAWQELSHNNVLMLNIHARQLPLAMIIKLVSAAYVHLNTLEMAGIAWL